MNKVVALTGGTGFLGYHLIPALLERGYLIRLLRRPGATHPLMKGFPEGVAPVDVDFSDVEKIAEACRGVDAILHAAGLVSYSARDQHAMWDTHVALTRRMLEAAKKSRVRRFLHVSSIVTIGHGKELRDESAEYNGAGLRLGYWDTKTEAEHEALAANSKELEVVIVNPGSLLGDGEKGGQLVPFLAKLARSRAPFLPDGGSDFLDVRDAALGCILALEKGRAGERYILGSENLTYLQLHERLRFAFGLKSLARLMPRSAISLISRGLEQLEKMTGLDLPINAARLRRVNGVYMFHDLSKSRRELGYSPGKIEPALQRALAAILEK